MSGLPQDGSHLADVDTALLLEEYGGGVESQFAKTSIMRGFVNIRPIRGTDTISNNRVGKTSLVALVPGVRPDVTPTPFGKVALTVDTVILARDNRSMLNEFQTHFDARMELAKDHGKMIGKFFDEAFIIQAIKGAGTAAPTGLNGAIGAGKSVTLTSAGDELDPDKLTAAIQSILTAMEEEDIDIDEIIIFVRPASFHVLLNNNKLINRDYSAANGDYSKQIIYELGGAKIVKTARIPNVAITNHFLSNANNGNAYDLSTTEAKSVAVLLHPKSLLAGETIPMTSEIWFNREEKQWFIDSYLAFGVTVNRPDVCGRVLKQ